MNYKTISCLLIVIAFILTSCADQSDSTNDLDFQLLDALKSGKLSTFKSLLKKGANPNAIFGPDESDWVMCEATEKRNAEFLALALEYGGNVNLRNDAEGVSSSRSLPIICAIYRNMPTYQGSVKKLLDHQVNLDVDACFGCAPFPGNQKRNLGPRTNVETPLMAAANIRNWQAVEMMIEQKLVDNDDLKLRWQEKNFLIFKIERMTPRGYTKEHNDQVQIVANKLISLGIELSPGVGKENSRIKSPQWGEPAVF